MPIQDEIKDALATLAMPEVKLMIERAEVPSRPWPKPAPNGTAGVHLGIYNLTVKPGTALRYALELINTAKAAMDQNIKAASLARPVPEDLAPPEEPCCDKHRSLVEHMEDIDSALEQTQREHRRELYGAETRPIDSGAVFSRELIDRITLKEGQSIPEGFIEVPGMTGVYYKPSEPKKPA